MSRTLGPRARALPGMLALGALLAAFAPVASASGGPHPLDSKPAGAAPASVRQIVGRGTVQRDDGLYRVSPRVGRPLVTHGPDAPPPQTAAASEGEGDFAPDAPQRQPVCATDFYQHVVYARPADTPSRRDEMAPRIRAAVGRMDAVLDSESLASGGPDADYKMLCDSDGQVRIDELVVGGTSFSEVVSAARAAGFASDRADFLIFLDGTLGGSCGIATYETDERLSLDNRSNAGGGYGLVYEPCWDGITPMHESAHLMGAVQYGAPHSTGSGGHCNEGTDIMCYSPDGGDRNQDGMIDDCPGTARFDCGFDDYFDSAPEPGEYLDTHWNLGSPLNRFLSFAGLPTPKAVGADAPETDFADGGKKRGATGQRGDWHRFRLRVKPRTSTLRVRLFAAADANLAMFVRRHHQPTRTVFHCRAKTRNRHASCRIADPKPGHWYAGVLTRGGRIGAGFKISARARR